MIIITRPSPYGEILTSSCRTAGLPAIHLPFFNITAGQDLSHLQNKLSALNPGDMVIAISPQVIEQINQFPTDILFPSTVQYYAVGKQTATLLAKLTQQKVESPPSNESSEGLLDYFSQNQMVISQRNILILCAKNGKPLLKQVLQSQHANVENIYIYHKDKIFYPATILDDSVDKLSNIDIIVVTSIANLLELENYSHNKQKRHFVLIVTSNQIKLQAERLDWKRIYLAKSANNRNLFNAISDLCHNKTIINTLG